MRSTVFGTVMACLAAAGAAQAQNTTACSASQINDIGWAQSQIAGRIDGALNFVADTPHYVLWFGAYDAGRAATVRSNLETIRSQALISQPAYTCMPQGQGACSPGTLAYLIAGTSFEVTLCDAFFSQVGAQQDSAWGTLLHEFSHFAIGPETDDHCYGDIGPNRCLALARNDPDTAIDNADNYQYFVERSPL